MDVLSGKTLTEALRTCDTYEGARIGIVCASSITAKTMIDSFWDEISNNRMPGWEIGREVNGHRAKLRKRGKKECSTIEVFSAISENDIHGRSYHQVLYERHLEAALINELCWCERLSFDSIDGDGSEALDEFLNSFKIV